MKWLKVVFKESGYSEILTGKSEYKKHVKAFPDFYKSVHSVYLCKITKNHEYIEKLVCYDEMQKKTNVKNSILQNVAKRKSFQQSKESNTNDSERECDNCPYWNGEKCTK